MWPPPPGISIRKAQKLVIASALGGVCFAAILFILKPRAADIPLVLTLFAGVMTVVYFYAFCILRIMEPDEVRIERPQVSEEDYPGNDVNPYSEK